MAVTLNVALRPLDTDIETGFCVKDGVTVAPEKDIIPPPDCVIVPVSVSDEGVTVPVIVAEF